MDIYLLIGAPGAGKGVQSAHLIEKYDLTHLSTGDIFRHEIKEETELGLEVKRIVQSGQLVSDDLTNRIVAGVLDQHRQNGTKGLILDGYPRTLTQVHALEDYLAKYDLSISKVILLNVSDEEAVRRASGRIICSNCKKSYHRVFNQPNDGKCGECGGSDFFQRPDDKEENVRDRLTLYHQQNTPVIDFYRQHAGFFEINGELPASVVSSEIDKNIL